MRSSRKRSVEPSRTTANSKYGSKKKTFAQNVSPKTFAHHLPYSYHTTVSVAGNVEIPYAFQPKTKR